MDCQMPVMGGKAATRRIREMESEGGIAAGNRIAIVAITGNAVQDEYDECQTAGMDAVLTKPFTKADLIGCIARWVPTSQFSVDDRRTERDVIGGTPHLRGLLTPKSAPRRLS